MNGFVFEIYPTGSAASTASTRIGFSVDDVDSVVGLIVEVGGELLLGPKDSEWGRRAAMKDIDGQTIELVTSPSRDRIVATEKASTGVMTETHSDGMNPGDSDPST